MEQPWAPAEATVQIRKIGSDRHLTITYTGHARDQMLDRDLLISDVLYVLKNGFVYSVATAATQSGLWKYLVETRTPNSGNRIVRVVAIPDKSKIWIKIVTVMWVDE